jgi:hypothetical protein
MWRTGAAQASAHSLAHTRGCERAGRAFLVDAEDHGVGRRIDVEADDIFEFVSEFGVARTRCGYSPCPAQIRRTEEGLIPAVLAIAGILCGMKKRGSFGSGKVRCARDRKRKRPLKRGLRS